MNWQLYLAAVCTCCMLLLTPLWSCWFLTSQNSFMISNNTATSLRAQMIFTGSLGHFLCSFVHWNDGSCLYQMTGSKESTLISIPLLSAVGKLQWRRGGLKIAFHFQRVKTGWGNMPFLLRDILQLETSLTLSLLLQGFKVTSLFNIIYNHMRKFNDKMDCSASGQYVAPVVVKYTI